MSGGAHLGPAPGEGEHRGFRHQGRYLLVARLQGVLYCIDDWCNHAGCLLSEGDLEGEEVICPCHDGRFRVRDGVNVTPVRLCEDQATYPVTERDGEVYLLGENG